MKKLLFALFAALFMFACTSAPKQETETTEVEAATEVVEETPDSMAVETPDSMAVETPDSLAAEEAAM